jgi:hypothetical protein
LYFFMGSSRKDDPIRRTDAAVPRKSKLTDH